MQGKIMKFETMEEKFVREVSEILNKLKMPDTTFEQKVAYLEDLEELAALYEDYLPLKYDELINLISLLISENDIENISESSFLEEALILCEIVNQEPNVDLFISLAFNDFEFVCSQFNFSEETIASIVDYLEFVQNSLNFSDFSAIIEVPELPENISPDFKKYNFTSKQIFKLWISLANLSLSDDLIIRIIKPANILPENYFLVFCSNLLLYYSQNELILSELIETIKKINYKNFPNLYFKNQVYCGIIASNVVPESIVAKVIKLLHLHEDDYYDFFYTLLKNYPRSAVIRDAIIERLDNDKPNVTDSFMPYIMRLRMLALNT